MPRPSSLVYGVLITVAVGAALGRICSTQLVFEPSLHRNEKDPKDTRRLWPKSRPAQMPTFGSNDRSRLATVRSLVEEGSYVVGRRDRDKVLATAVLQLGAADPFAAAAVGQVGFTLRTTTRDKGGADTGIIFEDGWQSVDKVLHPSKLEFYSSKPPLLSTLLAGVYWLMRFLLGWTLTAHPDAVVRTMLVLVNGLPFLLYLWQIARLADSFGRTEWGRTMVVAAAGFATLVTPFLTTLNNHTIATFCVLFTLTSVLAIWRQAPRARGGCADQAQATPWGHHVSAGLLAAFAVCNELPALAFAAAVFLLLLLWDARRALLIFLPAAAIPALGFLATNYAAVGQLRPAYSEFGSPWYEYEGSHWRVMPGQKRGGIDFARHKESQGQYVAQMLVGHHGLFSLTPLWLLALVPMIGGTIAWRRNFGKAPPVSVDASVSEATAIQALSSPVARGSEPAEDSSLPWFIAPLTLGLTLVVVGFYAVRSDNYGGFTIGLRWLMWLTPLWLLCLLPILDRLSVSRWGRGLAYLCLGVSVLSANYSPWNPWRHPWLYDLFMAFGWPGY